MCSNKSDHLRYTIITLFIHFRSWVPNQIYAPSLDDCARQAQVHIRTHKWWKTHCIGIPEGIQLQVKLSKIINCSSLFFRPHVHKNSVWNSLWNSLGTELRQTRSSVKFGQNSGTRFRTSFQTGFIVQKFQKLANLIYWISSWCINDWRFSICNKRN